MIKQYLVSLLLEDDLDEEELEKQLEEGLEALCEDIPEIEQCTIREY